MNFSKIRFEKSSPSHILGELLRKFLPCILFIGNFAKLMKLKLGFLNGDGYMKDQTEWKPATQQQRHLPKNTQWWLSTGSMSLHLKTLGKLSIQRHDEAVIQATGEIAQTLKCKVNAPVWKRTTTLSVNNTPKVAATSWLLLSKKNNQESTIQQLGDTPLGSILFHPNSTIKRTPLKFKYALHLHPILSSDSKRWARRSLFLDKDLTLLLEEIFL